MVMDKNKITVSLLLAQKVEFRKLFFSFIIMLTTLILKKRRTYYGKGLQSIGSVNRKGVGWL